jgi:hypothetical protein
MLLKPITTPQAIEQRVRDHHAADGYLFFAWAASSNVYAWVGVDFELELNGRLNGSIELPEDLKPEDGMKLLVQIFPVLEGGLGSVMDAFGAITYPAHIQALRAEAEELIAAGDLGEEIWRGLANIYERTEQPY